MSGSPRLLSVSEPHPRLIAAPIGCHRSHDVLSEERTSMTLIRALWGDLGFLFSNTPALVGAVRNKQIGREFMEKIMMVVSAINGRSYCSWFHARQAVSSGMSDEEISSMFNLQFEAPAVRARAAGTALRAALRGNQPQSESGNDGAGRGVPRRKTVRDGHAAHPHDLLRQPSGQHVRRVPRPPQGPQGREQQYPFRFLFFLATAWFMLPGEVAIAWQSQGASRHETSAPGSEPDNRLRVATSPRIASPSN